MKGIQYCLHNPADKVKINQCVKALEEKGLRILLASHDHHFLIISSANNITFGEIDNSVGEILWKRYGIGIHAVRYFE